MSDTLGHVDEVSDVLEAIPDATFIVQDGRHVHCNRAALRFFGLASSDDLGHRPFHEFVHPDEQAAALVRQERILGGETISSFVERSPALDGGWRHLEMTGAPTGFRGRPAALYVVRDVTERMRDAERSRTLSERLGAIVDSISVGAGLIDDDGIVRTANRALRELVDIDPVGLVLDDLFEEGDRTDQDFAAGQVVELALGPNVGRWVRITRTAVTTDGRHSSLIQVEDVDEAIRQEQLLEHRTSHDPVTGLPNRAGFLAELTTVLAYGPVAITVLDLDGFTLVNESHGLTVGDEVLRQVGERLVRAVRPADTVARLAGDSFAILSPFVGDADQAVAVARRCHAAIGERMLIDEVTLHLRASVGVSVGHAGDTAADVLRSADAALASARRAGGGRVEVARADASENARRRLALDAALRHALRYEDIQAHLQPIWQLEDGRCIAFEALARWTLPDGERIRPDRFVTLAEELHLSSDLDIHVAHRAALIVAREIATGRVPPTTYVTVNVDPVLLCDPTATQDLLDGVSDTGLEPERLVVEITERRLPEDGDALRRGVELVQAAGGRIALDDFGVGQSSLARLITLPFDIIKLDRLFVRHIQHARGRDVVAGIVEMSNRVQLLHVVEGIETHDERLALLSLGVETGQGWLVAPALSPDEVARFDGRPGRFD